MLCLFDNQLASFLNLIMVHCQKGRHSHKKQFLGTDFAVGVTVPQFKNTCLVERSSTSLALQKLLLTYQADLHVHHLGFLVEQPDKEIHIQVASSARL